MMWTFADAEFLSTKQLGANLDLTSRSCMTWSVAALTDTSFSGLT